VEEEKKCAKLAAELSASKGEVADLKAKLEADGEKFALLKTECEECAHSWNTLRERIVGMCARFETKLGGARKEDDFKALTDEKLVESFMLLDDKVRQYGSGTPRPITERIRPMKPACSVGGRKRLPDHVCEVS